MSLPVRDQLRYWGIAAIVFAVVLWFLGNVLMPFIIGAAVAYFIDPVADRLGVLGVPYLFATGDVRVSGASAGASRPILEKPFVASELVRALTKLVAVP